jgi:hypothetical protein
LFPYGTFSFLHYIWIVVCTSSLFCVSYMPCQLQNIPLRYFITVQWKAWAPRCEIFPFECLLFQVKYFTAVFAEHIHHIWLGIDWVFWTVEDIK